MRTAFLYNARFNLTENIEKKIKIMYTVIENTKTEM